MLACISNISYVKLAFKDIYPTRPPTVVCKNTYMHHETILPNEQINIDVKLRSKLASIITLWGCSAFTPECSGLRSQHSSSLYECNHVMTWTKKYAHTNTILCWYEQIILLIMKYGYYLLFVCIFTGVSNSCCLDHLFSQLFNCTRHLLPCK
jgi:hypothetical protein